MYIFLFTECAFYWINNQYEEAILQGETIGRSNVFKVNNDLIVILNIFTYYGR